MFKDLMKESDKNEVLYSKTEKKKKKTTPQQQQKKKHHHHQKTFSCIFENDNQGKWLGKEFL